MSIGCGSSRPNRGEAEIRAGEGNDKEIGNGEGSSRNGSHHGALQNRFRTLDPPPPPTDLIAPTLAVPLHAVNVGHRGRKLRLIAQILTFHPPTSLLLLTATPSTPGPGQPSPTILVNISIPLLGQSPSLADVSAAQDGFYSRTFQVDRISSSSAGVAHRTDSSESSTKRSGGMVNREMLSLTRGEWVCVVGWLEGDGQRMVKKVKTSTSFIKPIPLILEAIHISNARPPSTAFISSSISSSKSSTMISSSPSAELEMYRGMLPSHLPSMSATPKHPHDTPRVGFGRHTDWRLPIKEPTKSTLIEEACEMNGDITPRP